MLNNCISLFQDQFHNPTGFDIAGKVQVEIINPDERDDDIPQLVGGVRQAEFPITKGQALIQVPYTGLTHHRVYYLGKDRL